MRGRRDRPSPLGAPPVIVTRSGVLRASVLAIAAGAAAVGLLLPPAARRVSHPRSPGMRVVVAGAVHVHSRRSGGGGTPDEIAAAARAAGLQFVVLTDHGDATRRPDPPAYRHGVLCLDAVEISAHGGHYVAIGLPQAPYPLGGDARDVVEDVARLGGFGFVAHGDSPRRELAWADWDLPVGGLEWMNLDSEWRSRPASETALALATYLFRPPETLATLLGRPSAMLARWDRLTRARRVPAIAATDAHALWDAPSYDVCFRTITTRLELPASLTGVAATDAEAVVAALRAGHHYTEIDALAGPAGFDFTGRSVGPVVHEGDETSGAVALQARVDGPPGARLTLLRNGEVVSSTTAGHLEFQADRSTAAYRVEVALPDLAGDDGPPWIVSNPIYVGGWPAIEPRAPAPARISRDLLTDRSPFLHEQDRTSRASVDRDPASGAPRFSCALGGGAPANQFAALVVPIDGTLEPFDRLRLGARSDRPLRLSIELRRRGDRNPPRWQRSVYLDAATRTVDIPLRSLTPVPPETGAAPLEDIGALLLELDMVHTSPGTRSSIVVSELRLER